MTESKIHNLDEQEYAEYFEFIIKGHKYQCRYPSGGEIAEIQKAVKEDSQDVNALTQFISPVGDAPAFEDVWKELKVPQIKAFVNMLQTEFGQ